MLKTGPATLWTMAGTLAIVVLAVAVPAPKAKNAQQDNSQPASDLKVHEQAADASQYVGAETCKTCHEQVGASYEKNPHRKTASKYPGPDYQGCEACHGPGKAHAESGDPDKIIRMPSLSREDSSKVCLKCHEFGQEQANFLRSEHVKNNVGCIDCHSIHTPRVQERLLKAAQPTLCLKCHQEMTSEGFKSFHPRTDKGVKCSSCHNPHGARLHPPATRTGE